MSKKGRKGIRGKGRKNERGIDMQNNNVEVFKNEVSHCKHEKDLIEVEIQTRKEENEALKRKHHMIKKKLCSEEKTVKHQV